MYTGPWNATTSRAVAGASSYYEGNYVCMSGARSGEHCAVQVYDVSPSDVVVGRSAPRTERAPRPRATAAVR